MPTEGRGRATTTILARLAHCAALALAASACGATSATPDAVPASATSGIAIARIDTRDATLRAALRERAVAALPECERLAGGRTAGHMDLSVEVDAAGETVAGILHTTFRSDALSECLARGLTGIAVSGRGSSPRARVRLEGR